MAINVNMEEKKIFIKISINHLAYLISTPNLFPLTISVVAVFDRNGVHTISSSHIQYMKRYKTHTHTHLH